VAFTVRVGSNNQAIQALYYLAGFVLKLKERVSLSLDRSLKIPKHQNPDHFEALIL
jgi:hypothetical protein